MIEKVCDEISCHIGSGGDEERRAFSSGNGMFFNFRHWHPCCLCSCVIQEPHADPEKGKRYEYPRG